MVKLDYITACVNTLDYLEVSFEQNKNEFDRFTVVTSERDPQTIKFAKSKNLNLVVTEAFYRQGAIFDRGLALNYGFYSIAKDADWVIHADCDVFVPKNWRDRLPVLDIEYFYGAQRVLLNTYQDFTDFIAGSKTEKDFEIPLGIGYGYFQMFNWKSQVIQRTPPGALWYPAGRNVCETDWQFRNKWGEHADHDYTKVVGKLAQLPFNVYHLGQHGQNHNGRVSPRFTL